MADTSVTITQGSGTNIDTRTEATNGNHRQVIVVGDPSTNAGVAPVDGTAGLKVNLGADNDVVAAGDVASGATDSGNPVKVGGKYNSTQPTLTDGQRGDLQLGTRGELKVNIYNGSQVTDFSADNADAAATSSVASKLKVVNRNTVFNGSTWDRMKGDSTDGTLVNLGSNNDVTVTGTVDLGSTDNAVLDQIELNQDSQTAILTTIDTDTGNIATAVQIIDNAISGNEMQVDVITMPTVSTTPGITGIGHGVKTVTTAGTDVALAASTACKRVSIQSQTDNTGLIAVGGSGVDATVATGTGIILEPGDAYELEIDNLADVYIDSTVSGEGVRFTYFT